MVTTSMSRGSPHSDTLRTSKRLWRMAHWKRNGWIKYSTSWRSVQNLPRHPTRQSTSGSTLTQA